MFYEFLGWRKWNFRLEVLLIFRRFFIKEKEKKKDSEFDKCLGVFRSEKKGENRMGFFH
jgi:hypothetical protein